MKALMDTTQIFPEMIDALGQKPNGERVLVGQVPMPPTMKAKEIIANYIGSNFSDEDSAESYALYICNDLIEWQKKQNAAIASGQPSIDDLSMEHTRMRARMERLEKENAEKALKLRAVNSYAFELTAKLCAMPVEDGYGHELLRRDAVMELVTQWRMKWDSSPAAANAGDLMTYDEFFAEAKRLGCKLPDSPTAADAGGLCAQCDGEGIVWIDGCTQACSACQDITDDSVADSPAAVMAVDPKAALVAARDNAGDITSGECHTLRRLIECAEILDKRPRPMCRDCADENGTCPNGGLECDMRKLFADAKALHNKLARPTVAGDMKGGA